PGTVLPNSPVCPSSLLLRQPRARTRAIPEISHSVRFIVFSSLALWLAWSSNRRPLENGARHVPSTATARMAGSHGPMVADSARPPGSGQPQAQPVGPADEPHEHGHAPGMGE